MIVVTFEHLRALNYCSSSLRNWSKEHNIPLRRFKDGVPVDEIRATGCPFAIKAAEYAEQQAEAE